MAADRSISRFKWPLAASVAVGLALTTWLARKAARRPEPAGDGGVQTAPSASIFDEGLSDALLLERLTWEDVVATAQAVAGNPRTSERIVAASETAASPAVHYLRGLLLLSRAQPEAAMAAFRRIEIADIPPACLYAVYRLQGYMHPRDENPYLEPLRRAIVSREVGPLIEARVEAREGNLSQSLAAYLKTDPAQWQPIDLEFFRNLRQHAGLATEAVALIRGALKAGRVPAKLRTDLAGLITVASATTTVPESRGRFLESLRQDPGLRQLVVTGAIRQLEVRRQFLNREYASLLGRYRDADPLTLPDETILLLALSAARQNDALARDHWFQELKRRFPTAEVDQWLKGLKTTGE